MTEIALPVLYSFRRCPYAMRARLALHVSGLAFEHREVVLKNKPAHMLSLSPKGTVPVMWLRSTAGDQVLEQSVDIMLWALRQNDPLDWLPASDAGIADAMALIAHNDGPFKRQLDRYKYPNRSGLASGTADRDEAALWLHTLDARLRAKPFLAGEQFGLVLFQVRMRDAVKHASGFTGLDRFRADEFHVAGRMAGGKHGIPHAATA